MSAVSQDIRHSVRMLARNPGLAGTAILTLAIALGANTAVFSIVNGVLLRALPYPEPERIFDVSIVMPPSEGRPARKARLDGTTLNSWREGARTVEEVAAYRTRSFTLSGQGGAEWISGATVSGSLFPLLRAVPSLGRTFREEEQQPGLDQVVLLSHELWRRRFQGDPRTIGESVTLEGVPHTVIGVMPAGFSFPTREVQLWTPLVALPAARAPGTIGNEYFPVVARLSSGASREQAEAEAQAFLNSMREGGSADGSPPGRVRLVPLRGEMVAAVRPALLVMAAAVSLVLLIACINLANILLARNSSRQQEMAIRSALGGGRARLVRQMLTETTLLSLAGGVAGVLVAGLIHRLLPLVLPHDLPRIEGVQLDGRVFLFAFLLSGLTGLVFGLLPALRSAGTQPAQPLRAGVAAVASAPFSRSLFVVAEVALAFVLLVGAGLLLRSFLQRIEVDLGYEPERVLTATLDLDPAKYGAPGRGSALFDAVLNRLSERVDIVAAGVVSFPPLTPGFSLTSLTVVGQPPARTLAVPQLTSPGTLRALGLELAAGRWLTAEDHSMLAPVAVVNETFAREYLAGLHPIGRQLEVRATSLEIVGVVKDIRLLGLDSEPRPEFFISYRNAERIFGAGPRRLTLIIRTGSEPLAPLPFLRALVLDLDPDLALADVTTMEDKLSASMAQPRFYALLLGLFAAIALLLASAGVYGVLSYAVARQTRAIGVRRALGARRRDILAMVVGKGFVLVSIGLVIGVAAAAGATRLLAHLLFGVTTTDPLSYLVPALLLIGAALLACYLPARRALRVDPIEALRYDG